MAETDPKKRAADKAAAIIQKYKRLSGDRGNWESHWLEISERVVPSQKNLFQSAGMGTFASRGEKRNEFIFDSTASIALMRFSSILDSLLTPRNQTWHRLMTSNPDVNKDRQVRLWFDEVNRMLFRYRYAPKANFSSQNQQNYTSLGAYGTGSLFIDDLVGDKGIRYRNTHLSEIYFAENHQGIVDQALRYFPLTARQAIQKWKDKVPAKIKAAMTTNPEQEFYFIHNVEPKEDREYGRLDYRGMAFDSCYVSIEEQLLLSEGGYNTFPYSISRYYQVDGEVYGRSPAMDVLPAIKTLNEEKKTVLKQGQRTVDPVLLAYDDGVVHTFSMKPGALNAGGVSADGRPLVQPLPIGNVMIGKELMDDERRLINDAFLVNLFQILTESPQMTATEVLERTREKGILLAPTIGRQQSEYLGPMIDREIDILSRQGILPPMPELLKEAEGEYRIEYDSPLSRAQRAEEAAGLMRTIESLLPVVNVTQNTAPLDVFDMDVIAPELAEIQGVPTRWLRSADQVAAIRADRQEQQETQTAIQAGPSAAAMIKAVGNVQKG